MTAPDPTTEPCTRCGGEVSDRTPSKGTTQRVGLTRCVTTWRLRFSRFRWASDPYRDLQETWTELHLCDWCAGDVFLLAQGLPARDPALRKEARRG